MKPMKLSHLLFSLAVISALVLAAIPAAPVYALSTPASDQTSISAADADAPANAVVCKKVVKWRDGHRVVVRVCRRAPRPEADGGS